MPLGRVLQIRKDALRAIELVTEVLQREAVDLFHADIRVTRELLHHERVGAAGDDDADLVPRSRQVLHHDPTAGRMSHAFADHAVKNAHRVTLAPDARRRKSDPPFRFC